MLGVVKRGDTFSFTASISDKATNMPLVGAVEKLRCHGKYHNSRALLVEMLISEVGLGEYLFEAGSTTEWIPNKQIDFDIEYRDGGTVSSTRTFSIKVEVDITNG